MIQEKTATKEGKALAVGKRPRISWSSRALGQVSWTIIDQALLGLSNFAATLVLARWLIPIDYGGYTVATAVFWMIMAPYSGLLHEPTLVFGSSRFHDRLPSYTAVLAIFHCCISAIIAGGFAAAGLCLVFWGSKISGFSLLGYALAAPVVLLLPLLRLILYVRSAPRRAAGAAGVYMAGMLSILYLLYRSAALSAFTAPLATAGASGLAIACMIAGRRFELSSLWQDREFARRVLSAHWHYGRWAAVTQTLEAFPSSFYYFLVPLLVGLEANAALRVLMVLIMPAIQANLGCRLLLVPALGRIRQHGSAAPVVWKALIVVVGGACLYALLIAEFGRPLMDLLYRGRYTEYAHFAWLIGLIPLPFAAMDVLASALRAHERPDCVLWANVISTVVTCTFGGAAVAIWGLLGAILGLLGGYVTTMLVMAWWILHTHAWAGPRMAIGRTMPLAGTKREDGN